MTPVEKIRNLVRDALKTLGWEEVDFTVEHPVDFSHGEYAVNTAMILSKKLGMNPKEVAQKIAESIATNEIVERVEVAGPGFINFYLTPKFFETAISSIDTDFGNLQINSGKKILVEHSSPNLFKPFHIGHMMNNAIGESLYRLMKASGADVTTLTFPSDISLGVAKAIFVLLEKNVTNFTIEMLGDAYVEGTKRYEDDESVQARVKELADNLYSGKPSPEVSLFNSCKDFNINYFISVTARLGSHFDDFIFESEAGVVGAKLVKENTPSVFTESEGAIVFIPAEADKHLNTAVFVNSQGNPTYEAKDLGLLKIKFDKYNPDVSVFVTDYQQVTHFDIVLDSAKKINALWAENSRHVPHGRMSFKGQKMSSRLGGVPLATEILATILEEVKEKSGERELSPETLDMIAIGAIKFSILKSKPGQNINFDPDTSLSFEGDSGPYLQYTNARINSILAKAGEMGIKVGGAVTEREVSEVEKLAYRFEEVVELSIQDFAPHHVAVYLLDLARAFNSWYANTKILDTENQNAGYNLSIAKSVGQIIQNGLNLLGIKSPERM